MAWGGEIFIEGQDFIKKELIKRYLLEDFSWIDDILPKEEKEEERQNDTHPSDPTSNEDVIIVGNVIGAQAGISKEDPSAL